MSCQCLDRLSTLPAYVPRIVPILQSRFCRSTVCSTATTHSFSASSELLDSAREADCADGGVWAAALYAVVRIAQTNKIVGLIIQLTQSYFLVS
jgi:hypothetical protein